MTVDQTYPVTMSATVYTELIKLLYTVPTGLLQYTTQH